MIFVGQVWSVQPWRVLSRTELLDRRWLRVTQECVELPNGTVIDEFHVLHSPSWAAVVAMTDQQAVVMVEQYRHGLGQVSLELPSGVIDSGEAPIQAAARELQEETGYAARTFQPLIELVPEPSRSTHRAHFFVASGAYLHGIAQPEASEVIRVKLLGIDELLDAVQSGRIVHAAHVGAILLAERKGLLRITT